MTREELKQEAIQRMNRIGIFEPVIDQFKDKDRVYQSMPPFGALYWLDEQQQKRVKEFEDKYNGLVYHVIKSFIGDMEMDCYMYVSNEKEEWEMDNIDLNDKIAFCYVENLTCPEFSEFGSIGFEKSPAYGLVRTA